MRYIAFNKPFQVMSQFTQPDNSDKRTLSEYGFPKEVYPVGRLDYDSEGLLLLSDDGRFIRDLLEPSEGHPRTYLVQVENIPTEEQLRQLRQGVFVEGKKTRPAKVLLLEDEPALPPRPVPIRFRKNIPTSWIELVLTEGRNRQVRRMTAAVDCPTLRLIRWAIGGLTLGELALQPGDWVGLSDEQIDLVVDTVLSVN